VHNSFDGKFQIGIAMSGAISAGAYTAGVLDFLIQALDEWEALRGNPDVPDHQVGLKVMSGASAGAITAAIGAVALADADQQPLPFKAPPEGSQPLKCYLPKLYETWVVKPGLISEDGTSDFLLKTGDLDAPPAEADDFLRTHSVPRPPAGAPIPVMSLLNSRLLDQIAKAGIDVANIRDGTAPGKGPRAYVSKTLHIYLTLSNLRGIPYKIPFEGGDYHMISHGDRVHYQINGIGTWETKSEFADSDPRREIDVGWLKNGNENKYKWKDYSICALASAAFPVGLAARDISATLGTSHDEYAGRHFAIEGFNGNQARIEPDWPSGVVPPPPPPPSPPFWFRTADGGIIDNDPFEYARFTLKENLETEDPAKPNDDKLSPGEADRAVIMISPFPEVKPIRAEGQPAADVLSVFSALMPSLINQARFKPIELVRAADPTYGNRYLIGPSRVIDIETIDETGNKKIEGVEQRYGIASGLLGGFGGFVARAFRDHDFQLGRRNCQRFLQEAFVLPSENKVFARWPEAARLSRHFKAQTNREGKAWHTIIPLLGTAKAEVLLPPWPQISEAHLKNIEAHIAERFDYLVPKFLSEKIRGFLAILLRLATSRWTNFIPGLIRTRVLDYAHLAILADLVRRNQIKEWNDLGTLPAQTGLDPDDIRAIFGELLDPSFDQRTVAGIVKGAGMQKPDRENGKAPEITPAKVEKLLALCKAAEGKRYEVWEAPWRDKEGGKLYTMASRAKDLSFLDRAATPFGITLSRLPLVSGLSNYFPKPRTDPPGVP
jgi:hypothetical protein